MGYQVMFYGGLVLSIVSLTLAILLFRKYQIKQVINDLTGIQFSKSKQQHHYHYQANLTENGRRTTSDIMIKKDQSIQTTAAPDAETELLLNTNLVEQTDVKETEILSADDETTLLEEQDQVFIIEDDMLVIDSNKVIENGGEKIV